MIDENYNLTEDNRKELVKQGAAQDGVDIIYRDSRWPEVNTKAERRSERLVSIWFLLSGIFALLSIVVYLSPFKGVNKNDSGYAWHIAYTPLLGLTFGLAVLSFAVAIILYVKKFVPEEIAVQQRHMGGSSEFDKETAAATLIDTAESSKLSRRKMLLGSAGFGLGSIAIAAVFGALGAAIKNPFAKKDKSELFHSGWSPIYSTKENETVFLRKDTGNPYEVALLKPEDLAAGSMVTVFPWRTSDGYGDTEESRKKLLKGLREVSNPVMLIRLRVDDAKKVVKRKKQESFNYGDYFAYSKICTHLGCPTSLYEQQTNRILCPCHQSQFDVLHYGKAIFGPAARALPQLPLTINNQGYFVAAGDFIEPVGPAFWERRS